MSAEHQGSPVQDPSQRAGNVTAEKRSPFGEYVDVVLQNEHLDGLQATDCILGAIIARGTIEGSRDKFTPQMTIGLMDGLAKTTTRESYIQAMSQITQTEGLRKTVFDMSQDQKFGQMWGNMSERAGYNPYTKPGMGSLDMVGAYLDVLSNTAAEKHAKEPGQVAYNATWKSEIMKQVNWAVANPNMPWDQAAEMSGSDNDYIRQAGNVFRNAHAEAQQAGMDDELIRQTVERLRTMRAQQIDLGGEALGHVRAAETARNIAKLFEPDER